MLGPTRRQFDDGLDEHSTDPLYRTKLRSRYREMQAHKVPIVFSLMHLSVLTGVRWTRLRRIVRREDLTHDYHVYPKPKSSGGNRWICVPAVEVRAVQDWITRNILNSKASLGTLHDASHAYSEGCSILKNAQQHAGAPWIVKVDLHNFFESVSERQVYRVFRDFGYPALISFEMARICTRVVPPAVGRTRPRDIQWRWNETNQGLRRAVPYQGRQGGHLPQGSPSSPMLSNLVMADLDRRISEIAEEANGVYTRYADDLVISFSKSSRSDCETVLKVVRKAVGAFGFEINKKKSHVLPPGARKVVTGLVVNDLKPRLKRETKNHIEVALHYIETRGLLEQVRYVRSKHPISYLNHLCGLIEFAREIEPKFGGDAAIRLRVICEKHSVLLDTLTEFSSAKDFVINHRS